MKPNLFSIATKELSQDGFFTWLIQWADNDNCQYDKSLNQTAKDFLRLLLNKPQDFIINKVVAGRQWKNIDIWVEVNDEYFICIEDKIDSKEHSDQLVRYKRIVNDYYKDKNFQLVFVYLKTGNESLLSLNDIIKKGYSVIDRRMVLGILTKSPQQNDIFNEFVEQLSEVENKTNSFVKYENLVSDWKAGEGFYIKLQELIGDWTDWRYVANQNGGFLGFWYHWRGTKEVGDIYIQIENAFESGIKLVIKVGDWTPNINTLYQLLSEMNPIATKNGLTLSKPDKFRAGSSSTLAIVQNAFPVIDGNFDLDKFIDILRKLEKTIDEYCEGK